MNEAELSRGKAITEIVESEFGIEPGILSTRNRYQREAIARSTASLILNKVLGWSSSEIGALYNRERTTIIYIQRTASGLLETQDPTYAPIIKRAISKARKALSV